MPKYDPAAVLKHLDAASAAFHAGRGSEAPELGVKFDEYVATARDAVAQAAIRLGADGGED